MAGRHLKEIFRAFHARDELAFRRAAMEIIEEEQAKHHNALARDLQKLLVAGGGSFDSGSTVIVPAPPKDREGEWDLAEVREPHRLLEDLILNKGVCLALENVVEEIRQWPALDAAAAAATSSAGDQPVSVVVSMTMLVSTVSGSTQPPAASAKAIAARFARA